MAIESSKVGAYSSKTILGNVLELQHIAPVTFSPLMECTLNARYNVYPAVQPVNKPQVRYFGMGIGGKYNKTDTNLSYPFNPNMEEMNLYAPIPFRCLPEDEDALLTTEERAKYRMRVPLTINGIRYYGYYLKMLEFIDAVSLVKVDPITHEETTYTPDVTQLNPTGQLPSTSGTEDASNTEILTKVEALATITGTEVLEAINALYAGDVVRASISEIAIFSGDDRTVSGVNVSGTSFSYVEAMYAQMIAKYTNVGEAFTSASKTDIKKLTLTSSTTMVLNNNS